MALEHPAGLLGSQTLKCLKNIPLNLVIEAAAFQALFKILIVEDFQTKVVENRSTEWLQFTCRRF